MWDLIHQECMRMPLLHLRTLASGLSNSVINTQHGCGQAGAAGGRANLMSKSVWEGQ